MKSTNLVTRPCLDFSFRLQNFMFTNWLNWFYTAGQFYFLYFLMWHDGSACEKNMVNCLCNSTEIYNPKIHTKPKPKTNPKPNPKPNHTLSLFVF